MFQAALADGAKLLKELKKLDDKNLLVEVGGAVHLDQIFAPNIFLQTPFFRSSSWKAKLTTPSQTCRERALPSQAREQLRTRSMFHRAFRFEAELQG